jgi:hypothetical protein
MATKKITELNIATNPPLSGSTIVVYNDISYQTSLDTLKNVLVSNNSHIFTNNQSFSNDVTISGVTNSNILNATNSTLGINTGSTQNMIGTVNINGILNSTGYNNNFGKILIGSGALTTGNNSESLRVANTNSKNIAAFVGSKDGSSRITVKNTSSNAFASSDFVAQANNGDDVVNFVTMGINSSNYTLGYVGGPNDAYVVNSGKDLYIGTIGSVPNYLAKLKLFSMNDWQNPNITIDNTTGLNLISFNTNSVTSGYTFEFEGNAKFNDDVKIDKNLTVSSIKNLTSLVSNLSGITIFNYQLTSTFYLSGFTTNNIFNIINVPSENNNTITIKLIIEQSSVPYIASQYLINSVNVTIKWRNGITPTPTANNTNIITLTLFRNNNNWNIIGDFKNYY